MRQDIQKQLYRMTFVVLVMVALGVWQREFVVTAINSNVFLNATIIGTFIFGLGLVFKYQFDLRNEITSFDMLQEKYNDVLRRDEDETDPFWRFQRCQQPAIIFSTPRIMGQAYFLISDEISRTGNLKISAGTMQTLIDGIDTKLDDQKSLSTYITGLLVFLGLIGTFVGLMVTLASVGKIIGDLDLSGGAGTESIQTLMTNLKTPLQGMATGFSSSLFGLITSLALGLIVRFQGMASSSLKLGFEAWLSSVVHITDDADGAVAGGTGSGIDPQHLRLMYNVAKYSLTSSNRTNRTLDRLSAAVLELTDEQSKHGVATSRLSEHMEKNAQYQGVMSYHLGRTAKALTRYEDSALENTNKTGAQLEDMAAKLGTLALEQSRQGSATGELSERMEEYAKLQNIMSHHLGRTAQALASHDNVALKLREIDVALNGRLDGLEGAIDRSSGNIESLTEELIKLGEPDESLLDAEYQRMMTAIETTIKQETLLQEPVAASANGTRPAGAPLSAPSSMTAPSQASSFVSGPATVGASDSDDAVGDLRDILADAFGSKKGENV